MKSILLVFGLLIPMTVFSTNYYVSESGNDSNSGKNPKKAFKTMDRLNQLTLKPGDKVLFRKGDVFVGELVLHANGKKGKPIVIGSYGEGNVKPLITGAVSADSWSRQGSMYSTNLSQKVKQLYAGNKYLNIARTPDTGYFFIDSGDSTSLTDDKLASFSNLENSMVRIQTVNWQWEIRNISNHDGGRIEFDSTLWHPAKPHFGYYLENNVDFMNKPGEWFYNEDKGTLSVLWNGDIENQDFLAVIYDEGIRVSDKSSYITIQDLAISNYSEAAISVGELADNINIQGNDISNVEVFGIMMDLSVSNSTIADNNIVDVQGRGLTLLEPQKCVIERNRIRRIGMIAGHGFDGVNSGTGIIVENIEKRAPDYTNIARHNRIAYNRVDSTGYGAIRADGAYNMIEYNVVREAVLTMNDGGGIYCWGKNYNYTHHNTFRKNIVINVHGNMESCAGNHKIITCLYMDNYTNHCLIEDNIFIGAQTGIILNDLSHSHTVRNNLVYNVDLGLSLSIWKRSEDTIRGNYTIVGNTIFPEKEHGKVLSIANNLNIDFEEGRIDSNFYISPAYPHILKKFNLEEGHLITNEYELYAWQKATGHDVNARSIIPGPKDKWWQMQEESMIFVNDSLEPRTFMMEQEGYKDLDGKEVPPGEFSVEPFSAKIFYRD